MCYSVQLAAVGGYKSGHRALGNGCRGSQMCWSRISIEESGWCLLESQCVSVYSTEFCLACLADVDVFLSVFRCVSIYRIVNLSRLSYRRVSLGFSQNVSVCLCCSTCLTDASISECLSMSQCCLGCLTDASLSESLSMSQYVSVVSHLSHRRVSLGVSECVSVQRGGHSGRLCQPPGQDQPRRATRRNETVRHQQLGRRAHAARCLA